MEQYIIKGGNPLVGEVVIGGAKNAALGILAAAIMTDGQCLIDNMPNVRDTNVLLQAMEGIGAKVVRKGDNEVLISGKNIDSSGDLLVDNEYIRKIRASYYLIGALLGKYKKAQVVLPFEVFSAYLVAEDMFRWDAEGTESGQLPVEVLVARGDAGVSIGHESTSVFYESIADCKEKGERTGG